MINSECIRTLNALKALKDVRGDYKFNLFITRNQNTLKKYLEKLQSQMQRAETDQEIEYQHNYGQIAAKYQAMPQPLTPENQAKFQQDIIELNARYKDVVEIMDKKEKANGKLLSEESSVACHMLEVSDLPILSVEQFQSIMHLFTEGKKPLVV